MRTVTQRAVVNPERCTACRTCIRVCPVEAITLGGGKDRPSAIVNERKCQACTICLTRCPEEAIRLENRDVPLKIGLGESATLSEEAAILCRKAHMYPDQIICYCHRIRAREIAAAILAGASTPERVAGMTGARTGCGILCITGVIRLLRSGGARPEKAPGHQWYGSTVSIWDLPEEVLRRFDESYYLQRDRELMDEVFPGGRQRK